MTRMIRVLAGLALGALLLAGCGGGLKGSGITVEDRIRANYAKLIDATNKEDIDAVMSLYSVSFYDQVYHVDSIKADYVAFFAYYSDITEHIEIRGTTRSGPYVVVDIREWYAATTPDGVRVASEPNDYSDLWRIENGEWLLYGDQQDAPTGMRPNAGKRFFRISRARPTVPAQAAK